ncbi:hypothetical protein [Actinomadura napierensis]
MRGSKDPDGPVLLVARAALRTAVNFALATRWAVLSVRGRP